MLEEFLARNDFVPLEQMTRQHARHINDFFKREKELECKWHGRYMQWRDVDIHNISTVDMAVLQAVDMYGLELPDYCYSSEFVSECGGLVEAYCLVNSAFAHSLEIIAASKGSNEHIIRHMFDTASDFRFFHTSVVRSWVTVAWALEGTIRQQAAKTTLSVVRPVSDYYEDNAAHRQAIYEAETFIEHRSRTVYIGLVQ